MSEAKVVSFNGCQIPVPHGEPIENIIEVLEKALIEARNGNLRAFAIVQIIEDGTELANCSHDFYSISGKWRDLWAEFGRLERALGKTMDG